MILEHTFNEALHLYNTPGRFVLSTSDVIDLCGLCDVSQIPIANLREATYRGKRLHKAIELYEQGFEWQDDFPPQYQPFMNGWFNFRDDYDIQIVGPHEKRYVYLHDGTDQAIGATVDLRFVYQDYLYIGDVKTIHPVSGAALKTKKLEWRVQGQSYKEATELDEEFLRALPEYGKLKGIRRMFIHIHPKLQPTSRTERGNGYQIHEFPNDDSPLWDGCVRLAMEKVAAGILPSRRDCDLRDSLAASVEMSNA